MSEVLLTVGAVLVLAILVLEEIYIRSSGKNRENVHWSIMGTLLGLALILGFVFWVVRALWGLLTAPFGG